MDASTIPCSPPRMDSNGSLPTCRSESQSESCTISDRTPDAALGRALVLSFLQRPPVGLDRVMANRGNTMEIRFPESEKRLFLSRFTHDSECSLVNIFALNGFSACLVALPHGCVLSTHSGCISTLVFGFFALFLRCCDAECVQDQWRGVSAGGRNHASTRRYC